MVRFAFRGGMRMTTGALSKWTSEQKHVVAASFLGWSLDAFDFYLLVFVLKDIAAEFKTDISSVAVAILLTLATRPTAAIVIVVLAAFGSEARGIEFARAS